MTRPTLLLLAAACAGALGLLATACATTSDSPPAATSATVSQSAVTIATPAGPADALLFTPQGRGKWPAVLVWSDLTGLRPAFADIGRRLAAEGYVVLVPNIFFRNARLDGLTATAPLTPEQSRERSSAWMDAIGDQGAEADARAYQAFLDSRPEVDTTRKAGVLGYQYGAPYAFRTAFAVPERIGAVAVLHPMRIATPRENSPHLFVSRSRAAYYVALARPDDEREPGDKEDLRNVLAHAQLPTTITVLPGANGFAISDHPAFDGPSAEATWDQVTALFRARLR